MAAVLMVALTACTRGSVAGSNATPEQVYGAGPTQSDVQSLLGSSDWWPTTPTFVVRPLDLPNLPESVRFGVGQQFVHIGTPEILRANYILYSTSSDASTQMTNVQNQNQTVSTPKVGDQSLYYGYRMATNNAIYSMFAAIRVGMFVINIEYDKDSGFAGVDTMSKIASRLVHRLNDVVGGKVRPSPLASADVKLLPPPGAAVTLVGSTRLPVEALAASLGATAPQQLVDSFHQAGVKDFLYGDYALDADLTMEVKTSLFTFGSSNDALAFVASAVGGSSNLDSNNSAVTYVASSGQYFGIFAVGPYAGLLYCASTTPGEAASRACETPFASLLSAWELSLTQ